MMIITENRGESKNFVLLIAEREREREIEREREKERTSKVERSNMEGKGRDSLPDFISIRHRRSFPSLFLPLSFSLLLSFSLPPSLSFFALPARTIQHQQTQSVTSSWFFKNCSKMFGTAADRGKSWKGSGTLNHGLSLFVLECLAQLRTEVRVGKEVGL